MANNRFKAYITNNLPITEGGTGGGTFWNDTDDELRTMLGAYWTPGPDLQPIPRYANSDIGAAYTLEDIFIHSDLAISEYKITLKEEVPATTNFYQIEEHFVIKGSVFGGWDEVGFEAFADRLDRVSFTDCTTFTTVPLKYPEHEKEDNYNLELIKTDFIYNFLYPNYEGIMNGLIAQSKVLPELHWERYMPNLYGYYIAKNTNEFEDATCAAAGNCFVGQQIADFMVSDNYAEWSDPKDYGKSPDVPTDFMATYKNIIFSADNSQIMAAATSMLSSFPMYIKMEWPSYGSSQFVNALRDAQLDDDLLRSVNEYYDPDVNRWNACFGTDRYQIVEALEVPKTSSETGEIVEVPLEQNHFDANVNYMSVFTWWDKVQNSTSPPGLGVRDLSSIEGSFIAMDERGNSQPANYLTALLKTLIFYGKLKALVKDNLRSWADLVKGKTCHSETVFFRVVKKRSPTDSEILQTIWIPDFPDLNITQYIDTQVGYDQEYYYQVSAFKLVIGANYMYHRMASTTTAEAAATDYGEETDETDEAAVAAEDTDAASAFPEIVAGGAFPGLSEMGTTKESYGPNPPSTDPVLHSHTYYINGEGAGTTGGPSAGDNNHTHKIEDYIALDDAYHDHTHELPPPLLSVLSPTLDPYGTGGSSQTGGTAATEWTANIKVVTVPSFKLIECGFAEFGGSIIDSPPVAPNVDIIPFKGVNNKLMINLNTSTGQYKLEPVIIYESDSVLIDKIRQVKNLGPTDPIIYKTDDRVKYFDIFRMTTIPTSYQDFQDNFIALASTTNMDGVAMSAASHLDLISPNVVYYYMFRAVDFHGYVSNPSPIYKVELVEEDGAIYPLIEIYNDIGEIEKALPYQISKNFQKLISIVPTYAQTIVNLDAATTTDGTALSTITGSGDKVALGVMEDNLFGKTFKIRLISKKTGRKMDFNLSFVHTKAL